MNVIIYGAGRFGRRIFWNLMKRDENVICFIDSNYKMYKGGVFNKPVLSVDEALVEKYDKIYIAIDDFVSIETIHELLISKGVSEKNICNVPIDKKEIELYEDLRARFLKDFAQYVNSSNMAGNVAEAGVFKGNLSKFINLYFSDRVLYLFDTFAGFDNRDMEYEKKIGDKNFLNGTFCDGDMFDVADPDYVMKKMTAPNNVKIYKGYFPESAEGVDDKFVFVNLDMDLYKPQLEGLKFFWPKMVDGGCILLHDYFMQSLSGVKKAVEDFEVYLGCKCHKITIGDGLSIALLK